MKILAFDTTTKFLSLAVYNEGSVCEYNLETANRLSLLLVPTIRRVLDALKLDISDIDYFAAGLGPGSFTGIRIGLSASKAFALALDKPLIGIPTLDALALNSPVTDKDIITAVDAKRGLVYSCIYRYKSGRLIKSSPYALLSKENFLKSLKSAGIILGDALMVYRDEILKFALPAAFTDRDCWYPKAHNIISLAAQSIKKGGPFNSGPIYLYPEDCQVKRTCVSKGKG